MTSFHPHDSPNEPSGAATAAGAAERTPAAAPARASEQAAPAATVTGTARQPRSAGKEERGGPDPAQAEEAEKEEKEEAAAREAAAAGGAAAAGDEKPESGAGPKPAAPAAAEAEFRGTAAEAVAESGAAAKAGAVAESGAVPGRPHKSLLAGAAIVGALLIAVPFLLGGGDDKEPPVRNGATPGTLLDRPAAGAASRVVGSASPSPHGAVPGAHGTPAPATGQDGRTVTVTVVTPAPASHTGDGRKPGADGAPAPGSSDGTRSGTTRPGGPDSEPWPGGVHIYSHDSGRCVGIVGSPGAASGSALEIWDCQNVSWHRWKFVDGTVRSQGRCMNVAGGSTSDGAAINWVTCDNSGAQQFRLNEAHDLTNPRSGNKCVEVKDKKKANGTRLRLRACAGTSNQKWSTRAP